MAEEYINIVELDIDQDSVVQKLVELQEALKRTKEETKKLEEANKQLEEEGKKNSDQYKQNSELIQLNKAEVANLSAEYRTNQKTLQSVTAAGESQAVTINKLNQRNAQLRAEIRNVDLTDKNAVKQIKDKNKEIEQNTKIIQQNSDAVIQQKMNIGNYASALDGLPGPLGNVSKGVTGIGNAFKMLMVNPVLAFLAAVSAALGVVYKSFVSTDSGATQLEQTTHNLNSRWREYLATLREVGIIQGLFESFTKRQSTAITQFAFEMDKLNDSMLFHKSVTQQTNSEIARLREMAMDQLLPIEKREEALTRVTELMKSEMEVQKGFAKQAYELELANTAAIYDVKTTALHQLIVADREGSEFLLANDASLARARDKMNDDQFEKLVDLNIKQKALEEDYSREVRRIRSQLTGFVKQQITEEEKAKEASIEASKKKAAVLLAEEKEYIKIRDLIADMTKTEMEITIKGINKENAEQTKQQVIKYLNELNELEIAREEYITTNLNDIRILRRTAQLDQEIERLEIQKQMELDYAEKIGADTTLIHQKYAYIQRDIDQALLESRLQIAANMFGGLSGLADEHTKGHKLFAAAEALINTYLGATSAFAQTPGGIIIKSAAAAAAIVAGLSAVKKIYAVKKGSAPSGLSIPATEMKQEPQTFRDGGTVMRSLYYDMSKDIKKGFSEALKENPIKPVLPVEQANVKQLEMQSVRVGATI